MQGLPLLAYIDPGTGSFLLQLLVGGLLASLATIKIWWGRVCQIFTRETDRSASEAE